MQLELDNGETVDVTLMKNGDKVSLLVDRWYVAYINRKGMLERHGYIDNCLKTNRREQVKVDKG